MNNNILFYITFNDNLKNYLFIGLPFISIHIYIFLFIYFFLYY